MFTVPRYFILSATRFDGVTPFTSAAPLGWTPADNDPNTPRHYAAIDGGVVGRLSFRDLLRPGSAGAIVFVRRWGPAGSGADVVTLRSLAADENDLLKPPDSPAATSLDQALETRPLLSTWSRPIFGGPTDALAVNWLPEDGGTVEIEVAEIQDAAFLSKVQAIVEAAAAGAVEFTSQLIGGNTTIGAWSGDLYVYAATPAGANVTLPPLANMPQIGSRLIYLQAEGSSTIDGDGAEPINNQDEALVPQGSCKVVTRTPFGWAITETAESSVAATLANAVAGTTVDIPVWTGHKTILVDFTARGQLRLPDSALVGTDAELLLVRAGADDGTHEEQCGIVPNGTQELNHINGPIYLGLFGSSLRIRRLVGGGWEAVSHERVRAETAAGNRTYTSGWPGRRVLRMTGAGAVTAQLPPYDGVPLPPDCELEVVYLGAATATVQRSAATEVVAGGGASGASKTVNPHTVGIFRFSGTEWLSQVA